MPRERKAQEDEPKKEAPKNDGLFPDIDNLFPNAPPGIDADQFKMMREQMKRMMEQMRKQKPNGSNSLLVRSAGVARVGPDGQGGFAGATSLQSARPTDDGWPTGRTS